MCKDNDYALNLVQATVYFPDSTPAPEVLTAEEAIKFLRLDTTGAKNPDVTLRYYREQGSLKATRIGRKLFYTKQALLQFLREQTQLTNPNDAGAAGHGRC